MIVGVLKETFPGERRVALVPSAIPPLTKAGLEIQVEAGAGTAAGYRDAEYAERGAKVEPSRAAVIAAADVLLQVRAFGAAPEREGADIDQLKEGQVLVGLADPLGNPEAAKRLAEKGVLLFALELLPRITRAQSMDVLSSMATVAGYKAVLLAANHLPRMFPLMMTAAGTLQAAHVFVIGAGVAGLQAIGVARKLGAVVDAYDVRPVVKEQVESLGAKFVEMKLDTDAAQDAGGYAKELGEDFYRKQRELMLRVVSGSDVVITTAAIPGKKAPVLVTKEMVEAMRPGSVVVDLAALGGGNCELTRADETIVHGGVTILGPTNAPADIPFHSSQMYAKNISTFLANLVKEGALALNLGDEIIRDTLITRERQIVNPRVRELLGLETAPAPEGES